MQPETVTIEKIVNGGYGFAHLATGQVLLVRHALPGESVLVSIEETKKNHVFGRILQILSPHAARRIAPCRYFGQCGGCNLQQSDYCCQLQIKTAIVRELLERSKQEEVRNSLPLVAEPIGAPEEFAYRQRLRLQVGKGGILGFHAFHSHSLVPIRACLLAGTSLNATLTALRTAVEVQKLMAVSSEVELQENPLTGKVVIIFHLERKPRPAEIVAAERFSANSATVERIFFAGEHYSLMGPYGDSKDTAAGKILAVHYPEIAGCHGDLLLSWEAGGFCQVNLRQNHNLIAVVLQFCGVIPGQRVLDLYCGMGNFAIPLALQGADVLGMEGQGSAIRSAQHNAARAGCTTACFRQSPIHDGCRELSASTARFDCVVIDPPRQGAAELAGYLATICRSRLVYISCDPATLCRDLDDLVSHGFTIKRIQPIDMFPQTHHIENVVLLEKNEDFFS